MTGNFQALGGLVTFLKKILISEFLLVRLEKIVSVHTHARAWQLFPIWLVLSKNNNTSAG